MDTVFQLTKHTLTPAPGTRVLRAEEYAALVQARDVLEVARQRAADMAREAEAAYARRQEEGYAAGLEQGKLELAEKMMETVLASVGFLESVEKSLVAVVLQSVAKIVGDMDDETRVTAIVHQALRAVRSQQRVIVRVAPADEKAVSAALAPLLQASGSTFMQVVADARLARSSCVLETDLGVVDASLKTQLAALERAFAARLQQ